MISFGLITEGLTDQIVIENILAGYFKNPDLDIRPLQPERDKKDENKFKGYGSWSQVFAYCRLKDFQEAFQFNDYIIIQIDTDVSEEHGYDIPQRDENGEFTPKELIEKVIEKFKEEIIGEYFYSQCQQRIIWAISVHSIECWLLPLYYKDHKKSHFKNCLGTLNKQLYKKDGFTIDAKKPQYYRQISEKYRKHRDLMDCYQHNPSLTSFVVEIESKKIVIPLEDEW
ncbi:MULTISPECIES: phage tail protein [unclassified Microcoleus]|uniref:phage tail protein n=1 Tax=unclassified Microcoleus TaxID=2642155 RepID=UPI002FCF36FC